MANLSENSIVRKSNPLIEAKFSGNLTPREMDLLTVLCATIEKDAEDLALVRFKISDLIKLFGLSGNSAYKTIADVSEKLLSRVITVHNKEEKSFTQHQILSSAKYYQEKGYAEYKFHDELRPYLLNIKGYAKYRMKYSFKLSSFPAKRLYELLCQYSGFSKNQTEWKREISLIELRGYLGIGKKEYLMYGHLKSAIIKPLIDDINKNSNINIELTEIKDGRKVAALSFSVRKIIQDDEIKLVENAGNWNNEALPKLIAFGVSARMAEKIASEHDIPFIYFVLDKVGHTAKTENIKNPAGLFVSSISSPLMKMEFLEHNRKLIEEAEEKEREKQKLELERKKAKISEDYSEYRKRTISAFIAVYNEDHLKSKVGECISFLNGKAQPALISGFKKYGWTFAGTINYVVDFFVTVEGMPLLTIEDFAKKQGFSITE